MWKIIGCILILFGSGACGFYGVEHMRKRLQELESVKKYTIFMKGEIRYGNRTIPEMLIQMERKAVGNSMLRQLHSLERPQKQQLKIKAVFCMNCIQIISTS